MVNTVDLTDEELAFLVYSTERLTVSQFVKEQNFSNLFAQQAVTVQNKLDNEYRKRKLNFKNFLKTEGVK